MEKDGYSKVFRVQRMFQTNHVEENVRNIEGVTVRAQVLSTFTINK